ncbi:MAG: hypothetical protein ACW985_12455 [Candidatus Thorarchaeota archaeon]|jgi:hypothetical protein
MKRQWIMPILPIVTTFVTPIGTFIASNLIMIRTQIWLFTIGTSFSEPGGYMFWNQFFFLGYDLGLTIYFEAVLVVGWILLGLVLAALLFFAQIRPQEYPIASALVILILLMQIVFPVFVIHSASEAISYYGLFIENETVLALPFPSVVSLIGLGIIYVINRRILLATGSSESQF